MGGLSWANAACTLSHSMPHAPPGPRYCGDQLTGMITRMVGSAPMEYMAQLQQELDEVDRAASGQQSRCVFYALLSG